MRRSTLAALIALALVIGVLAAFAVAAVSGSATPDEGYHTDDGQLVYLVPTEVDVSDEQPVVHGVCDPNAPWPAPTACVCWREVGPDHLWRLHTGSNMIAATRGGREVAC